MYEIRSHDLYQRANFQYLDPYAQLHYQPAQYSVMHT